MSRFEAALANPPPTGTGTRAVDRWMLTAANLARMEGVDQMAAAAMIDAAVRTVRPPKPGEVERAVRKAYGDTGGGLAGWKPTAAAKREKERREREEREREEAGRRAVRKFILDGGDMDELEITQHSPAPIEWDAGAEGPGTGEPWRDTVLFLETLFRPGDCVALGDWVETAGRTWLKYEVRTLEEWISHFTRFREWAPTLTVINPVKPECRGRNKVFDGDVAAFRNCLAEMDHLDLEDQVRFWWGAGVGRTNDSAGWAVPVAMTFSSHRSYHVVLRLDGVPDAETWARKVAGGLYPQTLVPLGCDPQCANANRATRLAGAWRQPWREPKYHGKPPEEMPPEKRQRLIWARGQ